MFSIKKVSVMIALALATSSAFAGNNSNNNNSDVTNNYNTTNNNQEYHNTTSNANASANALANSSANALSNSSANQVQGQGQKQGQGQLQGQQQATSNANNSSLVVGGDRFEAAEIPVATAFAGNAISTAPCRIALSAGLSLMNFGGSFGGSVEDTQCSIRALAASFVAINMVETARDVLCQADAAKNLPSCQASIANVKAVKKANGNNVADLSGQEAAVAVLSK